MNEVVDDDERKARAALTRVAEPGDVKLAGAVAEIGAVGVLDAIVNDDEVPGLTRNYRARLPVDPEFDLAEAARIGARLVCPGDLEWPTQLDDLGAKAPLALWVRGGPDLRLWALRSVAVVGSRAATGYGEHAGSEISLALAERGWTVVSGGAYGIDAAAHRGALAAAGRTVAVLACGVDVAYPKSNDRLLARIAGEGLIVSELPPGCGVTKARFLERNRVISGLTRGTLVVEAALRSGALNTARWAGGLNRHVMALPGPVSSDLSAGCHALVRAGEASLATSAADVIDLVGELGTEGSGDRGPELATDGLDPDTMRVLESLPARLSADLDTLSRAAGLAVPVVLRGLGSLTALGLAEQTARGWRLAAVRTG